MTHPLKFLRLQLPDDSNQDLSSMCYSSLSDSSYSSNENEEERQKQKVIERKYSRLAFTVQRVGKDETETETETEETIEANEIPDQERDDHDHEHNYDLDGSNEEDEEQKKKVIARRYSRLAFTVQQVGKK